jgi:hypothetical protein
VEKLNPEENKNVGQRIKKVVAAVAITLGAAAVLCFGLLCFAVNNERNIYPNVYIEGINVGGMSEKDAFDRITSEVAEKYLGKSLNVNVRGTTINLSQDDVKAGIYTEDAVSAAYNYGRGNGLFKSVLCYAKSLLLKVEISSAFKADTEYISDQVAHLAKLTDMEKQEHTYRSR